MCIRRRLERGMDILDIMKNAPEAFMDLMNRVF